MADNTDPQIGSWFKVSRRDRPSGSKRFHYQWESEDGEIGFVVHKRNGKGFKMFLDSNDDGLFDSNDTLITRGPLQEGFEDVRPGRLLVKAKRALSRLRLISPKATMSTIMMRSTLSKGSMLWVGSI